ncbi:hypothetical protein MNBD_NITROSPINAE02-1669 [hydrothermal vent metagenome]|uniref:VTT domain-containing protein n=1 Tax=hydrothermal vent metagenome TaxID=652676 RepID=A0A3B1CKJ6_9ZZZZ
MQNKTGASLGSGARSKGAIVKLFVFLALAIALFVLIKFTNLGGYFSREHVEGALKQLGVYAPIGFVAIYAIATIIGVPGTILTIIGGVIFGSILGTISVVAGATIGACGAFFVSRFLARDFVAEKFMEKQWFKKLDKGIEDQGLYYILFIRLVPLFPFNGINFASGLTSVKFRDYFIGTAVGIIPASFVFVNAASKASDAASKGEASPGLFISLALLGLLTLAPVAYKKYKSTK